MAFTSLPVFSTIPGRPPYIKNPRVEYESFDSLGELVDLAWKYKQKEKEDNCLYVFRGETNCYNTIQASLFNVKDGLKKEDRFYQKALSSMPEQFRHLQTTFDRLSQMRHYEFPVRLLDVSENILTALFMALDSWQGNPTNALRCKYSNIDPQNTIFPCPRIDVIRIPKDRIKEAESDLVTNICCLAKVKEEFSFDMLFHEIKQENLDFHEDVFWNNFQELFTNWCVYPRFTNPRIAMQQGMYVLFGLSESILQGHSISEFLLRGDSLKGAHFHKVVDKDKDRPYTPIPVTYDLAQPNEQISHTAWIMPSENAIARHSGSLENYVKELSHHLDSVGYSQYMMYHDDFVKHAMYWRDHLRL